MSTFSKRQQEACGFIVQSCEALDLPDVTMQDIFERICSNNKAVCASWFEKGAMRRMRYFQFRRLTTGLAVRLDAVLPRDQVFVALHMPNSHLWAPMFWALLMTGHVPVLLDYAQPIDSYRDLLAAQGISQVLSDSPGEGCLHIKGIVSQLTDAEDASFHARWENRLVFITSGTSGQPQMLVFNGQSCAGQIQACRHIYRETTEILYPPQHGPLRQLALLPLSHIFGFTICVLWYPFFGKEIVFLPGFTPKELVSTCKKAKVTHLCAVPGVFDHLVKAVCEQIQAQFKARGARLIAWLFGEHPVLSAREEQHMRNLARLVQPRVLGKHIRYLISGGAKLSRSTAVFLNRLGFYFCNGYGMTELGILAVETSTQAEKRSQGSVGKGMHGVLCTVSDTGQLLVDCQYGAIAFLKGGEMRPLPKPFPTGDSARILPDGRMHLVGRMDELIIDAHGHRFHPQEIEQQCRQLQGVAALCVLPVKDRLHLVLVAQEQTSPGMLAQQLEQLNRGLLPAHRISKAWLAEALPMTKKREIDRHSLTKLILQGKLASITMNEYQNPSAQEDGYSKEVRVIFSTVLKREITGADDYADFFTELGGDSLSHFLLISEIEKRFSITLDFLDRRQSTSVARCSGVVSTKKGNNQL